MNVQIPRIERILHPTDLSEHARRAFAYAASLANRFGAKITVLYVLDEGSPNTKLVLDVMLGKDGWAELRSRREGEVIQEIRKRIEGFCRQVSDSSPECPYMVDEVLVETGHPVERILGHIEGIGADIVVMGSHGYGAWKEAMLGSTSRRVIKRSPRPVLIAPWVS